MDLSKFSHGQLIEKPVQNKIGALRPGIRNVEAKVICVRYIHSGSQKNGIKFSRYQVADETGSVYCDFTGDFCDAVEEGDIVYLTNFATNMYKGEMVLYQGKFSRAFILGKHLLEFDPNPNVSEYKHEEGEILI
jgi:hypothetical protein